MGGLEVIADEPTPSPIKSRDGAAVLWTQTRTLLLGDGSTVYGCQHCDYTSPNVNAIRPHLQAHNSRRGKKTTTAPTGDLTLAELVARLAELDKVTAALDEWRTRALKAEKALRTLRNLLGDRT
ncbi:hypothetical protein AOZ06_12920 [Kibdelosporangium phytohabitans]|uniref:Zinc finger protein 462-like seventh C2H2 zinc finger domain-containing protein n=1 Tax=Kibdelosporangium phytohabitans TaxID=860235 RepID=A0A0N9IE21_9PSEU|nr:hypothetical protein AOZ06_12600 [Kibdelosporangium phytohabitans]ALG14754.1 hypothetical protein AOZ06_12920 [Kibdelosporangium phytohabitans]